MKAKETRPLTQDREERKVACSSSDLLLVTVKPPLCYVYNYVESYCQELRISGTLHLHNNQVNDSGDQQREDMHLSLFFFWI